MSSLRILLRNYTDFERALSAQARAFERGNPGVRVELIAVGIHELHSAALVDGGLRDGRFDLALLVTDWLSEGVASGSLENLNPWQDRLPLPQWPEGWPASLRNPLLFENYLSAIPWHDGPECLVYRTDVFADPERRAAFLQKFGRDLRPPATWDEFTLVARFLTDLAKDFYGTVIAAYPDGHNTLYDLALQVWSRGGELVNSEGRPTLNTPEAIAALNFYREVVADPSLCHPSSPELDSTKSGDLFMDGKVAMMVNWFGFASRASRPESPLNGKVDIAPVPADGTHPSVSLSVFWALAMGTGSRQKDLAWEFLQFVTSPEQDMGIIQHGPVGTRLSTWRDPDLQRHMPVYRHIEGISMGARQLPRGPGMAQLASIVDLVVTRALTTSDSSAVILEAAQSEVVSRGLKFE